MTTRKEMESKLRLISKAWGRRQKGYCFFPWIDREQQRLTGSRRAGYHEGPDPKDPSFKWPEDREKILNHMLAHEDHDLYWCPSLFEYPWRREDVAMDEHCLWADLDAIDPITIEDYPPTIAWESSPGRYQALWLATNGDFQGASWPGNENQRLTYYIGADRSGWDTTQLLRVPGWFNHKPEYESEGKYPKGKLLWSNGPEYIPGDFSDLPPVNGMESGTVTDALEDEIESIDRHKVLARVKLKLTRRVRDLLSAREAQAHLRSDALWEMERSLADAGCSVAEIVAIVRETVWNKYTERADEMKRLILEASKAIAAKPDGVDEVREEEEIDREPPRRFGELLRNVKRPVFLVENLLTEGSVGFIAGEPKCYKSWFGLDLALSIATGADFLGHFRVINPGPILYIQEEDPLPTLKIRSAKVWQNKATDKLVLRPSADFPEIEWLPPERDAEFDPDINAYVQKGLVLSDEAWQLWLDETLAKGMDDEPYRLMIIDTLMMTAGEVDENRSQEMTTKIFKPLKTLARKHNVAIRLVHHMGKGERARAGQRLLGSVANHAWSEDSLYLSRAGNDIKMELESKTAPGNQWRITDLGNRQWTPQVNPWRSSDDDSGKSSSSNGRSHTENARTKSPVIKALEEMNRQATVAELAKLTGITKPQVWRTLRRAEDSSKVIRTKSDKGIDLWALTITE